MSFFAPKMVHNSPFYKGKLMRWRAKRAEKNRVYTGRKSAAGEKNAILGRFQRGEMVKKGYFGGFSELRFFVNNSTDFFKISDFL